MGMCPDKCDEQQRRRLGPLRICPLPSLGRSVVLPDVLPSVFCAVSCARHRIQLEGEDQLQGNVVTTSGLTISLSLANHDCFKKIALKLVKTCVLKLHCHQLTMLVNHGGSGESAEPVQKGLRVRLHDAIFWPMNERAT